jgi:hypothetical protein
MSPALDNGRRRVHAPEARRGRGLVRRVPGAARPGGLPRRRQGTSTPGLLTHMAFCAVLLSAVIWTVQIIIFVPDWDF